MKPYDWCNDSCPNPCSCQETIERNIGMGDRDDWPVHQPECHDAPIPGRQWFSGCEPGGDWDSELGAYTGTGPRVDPATGRCESCRALACPSCGRENCPDHELAPVPS